MGNCFTRSYKRLGGGIIIEPNQKYSHQHESIQKLTAMTMRLENTYNYYQEQHIIHKLKAIAYEQEGHDTNKALYYLKVAQHYDVAKKSISDLQILLTNVQIKLRMAVETSETMEIIKDQTDALRNELNKIYNETKIVQTLNNLEHQMDKVNTLQDLIKETRDNITDGDKKELKQWCKDRYQILKNEMPVVGVADENYYASLYRQDQQQGSSLPVGQLLITAFDKFFASTTPSTESVPKSQSAGTATSIVM